MFSKKQKYGQESMLEYKVLTQSCVFPAANLLGIGCAFLQSLTDGMSPGATFLHSMEYGVGSDTSD
jgi:hypothetical protein